MIFLVLKEITSQKDFAPLEDHVHICYSFNDVPPSRKQTRKLFPHSPRYLHHRRLRVNKEKATKGTQ